MHNRVKQAFDGISASEVLKAQTKARLASCSRRKRMFPVLCAAACMLTLVLGGCGLYFTPTARISMDVNPSLELAINCFDRVISATGCNDDGTALLQSVSVCHLPYREALDQLLTATFPAEEVTLAVSSSAESQCQRLLAGVETIPNASCHTMDPVEAGNAHELGLSCGKYHLYLQLQDLDPSITVDQVRNMTIRQLRAWIDALCPSATEPDTSETVPHEQSVDSEENGHGQGHGRE